LHNRDFENEARIKIPQTLEDSYVESTKKVVIKNKKDEPSQKMGQKSANAWDYFENIFNTPTKSTVIQPIEAKKSSNKKLKKLSSVEIEEVSENDYCVVPSKFDKKHKNTMEIESLLEKRKGSENISEIEEKICLEGKLSKKKVKLEKLSQKSVNKIDIEDLDKKIQEIQLDSDRSQIESEVFKNQIGFESQVNLNRKKKKAIRILDEEEFSSPLITGKSKKGQEKRDLISLSSDEKMIEEEKIDLQSPETIKDSDREVLIQSSGSSSPKQIKQTQEQVAFERNKLKRLKKIVDNRRETLNKGELEKSLQKSHEHIEKVSKVETCPICLSKLFNYMYLRY